MSSQMHDEPVQLFMAKVEPWLAAGAPVSVKVELESRFRRLSAEAAGWRKKTRAVERVLAEYQAREIRRLVAPFMPWDAFMRLIGCESVIDAEGEIDVTELVTRLNIEHKRTPSLVPRRVEPEDLAGER